jgi:quercetin dioxygenase-like cupin family protein
MAGSNRGFVRPAAAAEFTEVRAGSSTRSQVLLGPADGMPHFAMRRFVMGEGGGMPRHTNTVEHEQFVLRGRARISIGQQHFEVGPEDVVFIPAGEVHDYKVLEAPFEFLCLVPNLPDTIALEPADEGQGSTAS